jgi:hypothetical protein
MYFGFIGTGARMGEMPPVNRSAFSTEAATLSSMVVDGGQRRMFFYARLVFGLLLTDDTGAR